MEVKIVDSKKKPVAKDAPAPEAEASPLFNAADELARLNRAVQKQGQQLEQLDWKLWVMMNAMIDYLIQGGFIAPENDPRKSK